MAIEVGMASGDELERWDSFLERSVRPSPFHRRAFLETVASNGSAELRPLVGYKGEEPVGLAPIFETTVGPLTMVYSPPPGMQIGFMGPVLLNQEQMKQRRLEKTNERFIDGCLDWIEREIDPDFAYFRCSDQYDDVRPFIWSERGYEIDLEYTYVVDLTCGEDELRRSFTKEARRNIRRAREANVEIRPTRDPSEIERIVSHYLSRHPRDGSAAAFDLDFAMRLYDALGSSVVSCHVCLLDDAFVGGSFNLLGGDTVYGWLGGAAPDVDVPVNDLLYWHEMQHAIDAGFERIDFLGAMKRSLCTFKAKFNPELRPKFVVRRSTPQMNVASGIYDRLPSRLRTPIS